MAPGIRILQSKAMIEDNVQDKMLIFRISRLASRISHIDMAGGGRHSLDYLFRQWQLSNREDQCLKRLSGLGVFKRLYADYCTAFILTSPVEEGDRLKCPEIGANSFVNKPVDIAEIVASLKKWLAANDPKNRSWGECKPFVLSKVSPARGAYFAQGERYFDMLNCGF